MSEAVLLSSELTDKGGNIINAGDTVIYNGQTYIVMCVDKDNIGWVGHPCANNPNEDSINLDEVHNEVEVIMVN